MKKLVLIITLISSLFLAACNDAQVASNNLSMDADMFKINRRIVFYNGINGEYILTIEGKCSIKKDREDIQLEVVCKTGEGTYKKHFLGISDNVTYFVEHLEGTDVSVNHYKVIFKPSVIIPDIEIK